MTEGNNENPMYATFLVVLVILLVAASFMNPLTYYFTVLLNSVFVVFPKSVQLVDTYAFEMKNILLSSNKNHGDENNKNTNKQVVDDESLAKLEALYRNFNYLYQWHHEKTIYDTIIQFSLSTAGMLSIVCILWGSEGE